MTKDGFSVYVHSASELLTDHEPHGDGLICAALLKGLSQRGYRFHIYTGTLAMRELPELWTVRADPFVAFPNSTTGLRRNLRSDRWFRELAARESFDFVWRMHPFETACPWPPQTRGLPLVVGPVFRSWPPQAGEFRPRRFGIRLESVLQPFQLWGWNRTLAQAQLLLAPTRPHVGELQSQFPKLRSAVLPVMIDVPETRAEFWKGDGPLKLLFVGHLVDRKHPLLFCEVLAHLVREGLDVTGRICGDGPLRAEVENFISNNRLSDAVKVLGKVPQPEVMEHLRESDLLLSLSQGEPYGRNIAEAMAMGVVPLCHRSGGPMEFVTQGQDGVLVDDLTSQAYARAVTLLYSDGARLERMAKKALNTAGAWRSSVVLDQLDREFCRLVGRC